jgi:hypothetical protein
MLQRNQMNFIQLRHILQTRKNIHIALFKIQIIKVKLIINCCVKNFQGYSLIIYCNNNLQSHIKVSKREREKTLH